MMAEQLGLKQLVSNRLLASIISAPLNLTVSSMPIQTESLGCIKMNYLPDSFASPHFGWRSVNNFCSVMSGSNLICGTYHAESTTAAKVWVDRLTSNAPSSKI